MGVLVRVDENEMKMKMWNFKCYSSEELITLNGSGWLGLFLAWTSDLRSPMLETEEKST